jgi:Ser/Thr protein kinase RdoA (MazF antagonist)
VKAFGELTYRGQVRRLRRLAQSALAEFGLSDARLTFIAQGENTTFRVDAPRAAPRQPADDPFVENRYVFRVHRPGYQSAASIGSELAWLAALRRDAGLVVPEPVPVPASQATFLVKASTPGVPEQRNCSLLRWLKGRHANRRLRLDHFRALGQLMGQLHLHASRWQPPPAFTRRHWDWDGLFGDNAGFNLSAKEVWALVPSPYDELFAVVADRARQLFAELGQGSDVFGLIHADLFLGGDGNVLFSGGAARPIDFDDCGFGYWVYDLAVPLAHWQGSEIWPGVRDALLKGVAQVRPVPQTQLAHLDLFMAARHVSETLWSVDMAQVNPSFRAGLDGWLEWAGQHVSRLLD